VAIYTPPEVDTPRQTSPRHAGGWLRHFWQRVRLLLDGDDELLVVQNKTKVAWYAYHNYHQLGIVDAGEEREFHLVKHGELSVRPVLDGEEVEYLVLPLNYDVNYVHIVRRQMGKDLEVYDMRVA
jgi:hypothetical protein